MALAASPAAPADVSPPGTAETVLAWLLLLAAPLVLALLWWRDVIRPGSPGRRGLRDPGPLPFWYWLIAAVCVFLTAGLGTTVVVLLSGESGLHSADAVSPMTRGWSTLAGFSAAAGLGALLVSRTRRLAPRAGLEVTWRGLSAGVGILLIAAPIVHASGALGTWLYRASTGLEPERLAHETLREIAERPWDPAAWLLIAAVVLAAPIAEEIAFRAFLQTAVLRLTRRAWPAIIIASAVFTLVHSVEPYAWPTIFVFSLCLGVAYERRRNLGVPIAMHALFNAANVALGVWG